MYSIAEIPTEYERCCKTITDDIMDDETVLWSMCDMVNHDESWIAELQNAILSKDGQKAYDIFVESRDEYLEQMLKITCD